MVGLLGVFLQHVSNSCWWSLSVKPSTMYHDVSGFTSYTTR